MNEPVENLTAWGAKGAASAGRWLLAALGVVCFGLGAVGAIVPGLPTTVFLLLGSFFLTKSCPWLERRLLQIRLFRPYAALLDPATPFSARGRATALAAMWISIVITLAVLVRSETVGTWLLLVIAGAGVVGTVVILRFRRHLERPDAAAESAHR
jgi:uncharacterized membrane protein YbaN (DUF454 family)